MNKNGKYFVAPQQNGEDFKVLFKRLAAAGVGRPVDRNGFAKGPWTPDLLADAISSLDGNRKGVDLRTVQLWFQDNEKGPSPENIRWLARVFGCDDPDATSDWQAALSAAQARLVAKRRDRRKKHTSDLPNVALPTRSSAASHEKTPGVAQARALPPARKRGLAMRSEAIFSGGSPLDLPATVFAGAVVLGYLSYLFGVHDVRFERIDGVEKQVGFIWAPNWTILFMVCFPLLFAFAADLVVFWKNEGRMKMMPKDSKENAEAAWQRRVEASRYTYWSVLFVCFVLAGVLQWIGVRLVPLLNGGGDYAFDWGFVAIERPEVMSVPMAIGFTGLAYLYMCLCFYLFFVALILLYTVAHDLWKTGHVTNADPRNAGQCRLDEMSLHVMRGIFRCTICGILAAICMKLQTLYLSSTSASIIEWLLNDASQILQRQKMSDDWFDDRMPTHYSSLLVALASFAPFLFGSFRLDIKRQFPGQMGVMVCVLGLAAVSYLLIGMISGFSILLCCAVAISIFSLFDPALGTGWSRGSGGGYRVS